MHGTEDRDDAAAGPDGRGGDNPTRPGVDDGVVLSRARGCLVGLLAGDALGSAVEFEPAETIARNHPDGVTRLADGGTWNLLAGQPTDDGEMALAMARAIVRTGGYDVAAVGAAYVAWRRSGPFDIGRATAKGIEAIAAGRRATSDTPSNGALMRAAPIGILAAGDPDRAAALAEADARLTHPSPVAVAANRAFCAALAVAIAGADREQAIGAAADAAGEGEAGEAVRARLLAARTGLPDDFFHQMGWVLTALQNAFFEFARGATPFEGVVATVARGGDTDTNGAVCGALLGALHGLDAIPAQWREAVLSCRPTREAGAVHPRPPAYWPADALDLAHDLLGAGRGGSVTTRDP